MRWSQVTTPEKAWDQGYGAGERDAHSAADARLYNGRELADDELTPNPYATAEEESAGNAAVLSLSNVPTDQLLAELGRRVEAHLAERPPAAPHDVLDMS